MLTGNYEYSTSRSWVVPPEPEINYRTGRLANLPQRLSTHQFVIAKFTTSAHCILFPVSGGLVCGSFHRYDRRLWCGCWLRALVSVGCDV